MNPLSPGKIPIDVLKSTVLKLTGEPSAKIVTPPQAGLDFAAVKVDGRFMVVSADPVTGVEKDIGRYAINVSANDVATSGSRPQFAESVVLLPEGAGERLVKDIATQMHDEARKLRLSIVGGHTEVTPGLRRPIVVVTTFSFVDGYVSSMDAEQGDSIVMTKTAGLEGTAVLGGGGSFLNQISVVEEAEAAYRTGRVHAMHDCTEGGVLGAVFEMSLASGLGFEVHERAIPVAPETRRLCRKFSADPLKLIGSGSLLLAVERDREREVVKALEPVCRATVIGTFLRKGRNLVRASGARQRIDAAPEDELWRLLSGASRRGRRL